MLTLRSLRYLVTLAETGHFGQAATRCHVSQPTLSAQLKRLEEHLGVPLVERRPRGIVLTPVGEAVVARARAMLAGAEEIRALAASAEDPLAGELSIGLIPTVAPYLLPHVVPALKRRFPKLKCLFFEHQTESLTRRLIDGEVDLAILATPVAGEMLESENLFDEPFLAALPPDHPLAEANRLPLSALNGQPMLLLSEGHCLRDQAVEVCRRFDLPDRMELAATSLETLRQMVAAGVGVTLLPALAVRPEDSVAAVPLRAPVPDRPIVAAWRRSSPRLPTLRPVIDTFADAGRRALARSASRPVTESGAA